MELLLTRTTYTSLSTEGVLVCARFGFSCYTLELPFTDGSHGSAISEGRYKIIFAPSPKFLASPDPWVQKFAASMPHLVDVPGRQFIMIHWGNKSAETDGCILVGEGEAEDFISVSRTAFEKIYALLKGTTEDIFITIQENS
jgi:Steigviridae/Suoliviridae L,D-carboxypeptidase/transpeptidase